MDKTGQNGSGQNGSAWPGTSSHREQAALDIGAILRSVSFHCPVLRRTSSRPVSTVWFGDLLDKAGFAERLSRIRARFEFLHIGSLAVQHFAPAARFTLRLPAAA